MRKNGKCLNCQTEFRYETAHQEGKYCNNKCQQIHFYETVTKPRIILGLVSERKTLKRYIIKEVGEFCLICKQSSRWNKLPLSFDLDHIDGNSDNNLPSNLRLLCPNCHSQQSTTKIRCKKDCKRNVYLRDYKQINVVRN